MRRSDAANIDSEAAPAADAYDSYFLGIHFWIRREEIYSRTEILGVDIGRGHVAWSAAAFACKRWIESYCEKTTFCHLLCV